jgi:hypothetical protein
MNRSTFWRGFLALSLLTIGLGAVLAKAYANTCTGPRVTSGGSTCTIGTRYGQVTNVTNPSTDYRLGITVCDVGGGGCTEKSPYIYCWGTGWDTNGNLLGNTQGTWGNTIYDFPCNGGTCSHAKPLSWRASCTQ